MPRVEMTGLFLREFEARGGFTERAGVDGVVRIDPGGGYENDRHPALTGQFKAVQRTNEVVVYHESSIGALCSNQHGRFRAAFDHEGEIAGQAFQVFGVADVAMAKSDAVCQNAA